MTKDLAAVIKSVEIALRNDGALTLRENMRGVFRNEILVEDAQKKQYILKFRRLKTERYPK